MKPSPGSFDHSTWVLSVMFFIAAGAVLAMPSPLKPDHQGYKSCVKLHPDRFCRIENGFIVPPLKAER